MRAAYSGLAILVLGATLASCSQDAGEISRDSTPFDGIADTAEINLLGNEPFWGLEVADGQATFRTPENIEGTVFSVARFAGNNGLGVSGSMAGEPVQATITPGACNDTMSDRTYPYAATVAIGDRTLYGCGYTSDEPFTGEQEP